MRIPEPCVVYMHLVILKLPFQTVICPVTPPAFFFFFFKQKPCKLTLLSLPSPTALRGTAPKAHWVLENTHEGATVRLMVTGKLEVRPQQS